MSMPEFPEFDPEISSDYALNMILASIAMEELALSHIINAEGEKLQYVLGTLEKGKCMQPDIDEILKVNQSVTDMLNSISQNQIILKNKMDKAINALSHKTAGSQEQECQCQCKCSAAFKTEEKCRLWHAGSALYWNIMHLHGKCISCNSCDKSKVELHSKSRFMVSFAANVRAEDLRCNAAVSLKIIKNNKYEDIFIAHSYVPHGDKPVTISMSGIIIENYDHSTPSALLIELESPDSLILENSMFYVMEI